MFRKGSISIAAALSVWLVASVALAEAPSRSIALTLSTPEASVEVWIENGQVHHVAAFSLCANGGFESWSSNSVANSAIEYGRGPNFNRVTTQADVVHTDCEGTTWNERVGIRVVFDASGKTARERDASTGTRTLTTPVTGTITLPNDVLPGAVGSEIETVTR